MITTIIRQLLQVTKSNGSYYIADTHSSYGINDYFMKEEEIGMYPLLATPPDFYAQQIISVLAFLEEANISMADIDLKDIRMTKNTLVKHLPQVKVS